MELVSVAMKLIRSAPDNYVYDGAARVAELRAEVVGLHLELLHSVNGGLIFQIGDSAVLLDVRDAHSIQQDIRGRVSRPVRGEVRVALATRIQIRRRYSRR